MTRPLHQSLPYVKEVFIWSPVTSREPQTNLHNGHRHGNPISYLSSLLYRRKNKYLQTNMCKNVQLQANETAFVAAIVVSVWSEWFLGKHNGFWKAQEQEGCTCCVIEILSDEGRIRRILPQMTPSEWHIKWDTLRFLDLYVFVWNLESSVVSLLLPKTQLEVI